MSQLRLYGCSSIEQYDLTTKLGEGTFGQVFKGTFKPTNTAVALKEIIIHDRDEGIPITALREIKIMKALKHPNVLHLLDMAVKKGSKSNPPRRHSSFYMVMSYMDHDLCGLLHNRSVKFTLPHIKLYMKQLLEGIKFLHEQQYMHRDIKSANILVSNDGSVKVADFGLARNYIEPPPTLTVTSKATKKYTPKVVTRWYRPPELLLGDEYYTPAIDMWGIGCILGEFFKRQVILPGQSDEDQIFQIFKLLGAPTEDSMPGFRDLPNTASLNFPSSPRMLEQVFSNIPYEALTLLSGLLDLNPMTRLTAAGCLAHEFFTSGVKPADPKNLPILPTSREIDVRRKRQAPSPLIGQNGPKRPQSARDNFEGDNNKRQDRKPNVPRAFMNKVFKRDLSPEDQIPPYRRNDPAHKQTLRPGMDRSQPSNKGLQAMGSGLDY